MTTVKGGEQANGRGLLAALRGVALTVAICPLIYFAVYAWFTLIRHELLGLAPLTGFGHVAGLGAALAGLFVGIYADSVLAVVGLNRPRLAPRDAPLLSYDARVACAVLVILAALLGIWDHLELAPRLVGWAGRAGGPALARPVSYAAGALPFSVAIGLGGFAVFLMLRRRIVAGWRRQALTGANWLFAAVFAVFGGALVRGWWVTTGVTHDRFNLGYYVARLDGATYLLLMCVTIYMVAYSLRLVTVTGAEFKAQCRGRQQAEGGLTSREAAVVAGVVVLLFGVRLGLEPLSYTAVAAGLRDWTRAIEAAALQDTYALRKVIEETPDVVMLDNRMGGRMFTAAIVSCNPEAVRLLLDAGASPRARDWDAQTPLHEAAGRDAEITRMLLDRGAAASAVNGFGWRPLDIAVLGRQEEIVQLLLQRGAAHSVFTLAGMGEVTLLASLLDREPSLLSARDPAQRTPLYWAAQNGQTAAVEVLLDRGAPADGGDRLRRTPLLLVAERGHADTLELLLKRGADPNLGRDPQGDTALHFAALNARPEQAAMLLRAGADPTIRNRFGSLPLDYARVSGDQQTLAVLAEATLAGESAE